MIKYFGIILLMICASLIGFSMSDKVKKHGSNLKLVLRMFEEIEIMIRYKACTINELIDYLKSCDELSNLDFLFTNSKECYLTDEIVENINTTNLILSDEEKCKIKSFFRELGTTDLNGQLAIILHYKQYFLNCINDFLDEAKKKCKLYRSMGVLGGAFLAVILI